jgi:hypothetical protein
MKTTAITLAITGFICAVMGALTALEVMPGLVVGTLSLSDRTVTALFWWGLAFLVLLTSIAFGVLTKDEL